jgi:hypothetical protein
VTTIRGSSIDQLSFAAILDHGNGEGGTASEAPGPTILGVPTAAVTLIANSSVADAGLTQEVVDISTLTNLPIRVLGYEGTVGAELRRAHLHRAKANPPCRVKTNHPAAFRRSHQHKLPNPDTMKGTLRRADNRLLRIIRNSALGT